MFFLELPKQALELFQTNLAVFIDVNEFQELLDFVQGKIRVHAMHQLTHFVNVEEASSIQVGCMKGSHNIFIRQASFVCQRVRLDSLFEEAFPAHVL